GNRARRGRPFAQDADSFLSAEQTARTYRRVRSLGHRLQDPGVAIRVALQRGLVIEMAMTGDRSDDSVRVALEIHAQREGRMPLAAAYVELLAQFVELIVNVEVDVVEDDAYAVLQATVAQDRRQRVAPVVEQTALRFHHLPDQASPAAAADAHAQEHRIEE